MEVVSEQGYRQDGRKPDELRQIKCKLGIYKQADGSAYLEQGYTKVLAAVYGPHEISKNRSRAPTDRVLVNCQYSTATFSTAERKLRPRGDRKSQEFTQLLQKTFEAVMMTSLYPHSQIDIFCEVLQSDGGNLSACINAANLALIDAGVPLKDYVVSCTCSCFNDVPVIDVNHLEETSSSGVKVTLAILPRAEEEEIVLLELNSRLHVDQLEKVINGGIKGCKETYKILNAAVRNHATNVAACLGSGNE